MTDLREALQTSGRKTYPAQVWAREKVVSAAPVHVRAVRATALDQLTATDQRVLARIAEKLRTRPVDLA